MSTNTIITVTDTNVSVATRATTIVVIGITLDIGAQTALLKIRPEDYALFWAPEDTAPIADLIDSKMTFDLTLPSDVPPMPTCEQLSDLQDWLLTMPEPLVWSVYGG
jgi:hypothetical protein